MTCVIPVETAERNLGQLLEELDLGETLTLLGPEGMPLAVVVSLKPAHPDAKPIEDSQVGWENLAEEKRVISRKSYRARASRRCWG